MRGYFIKKVGSSRKGPRIWLQGDEVAKAGLGRGDSFQVHVQGGSVILRADPNGDRVVSGKLKGNGDTLPIIDINSKELLALFDGMDAIRLFQRDGEIYLTPLPTELRKKERTRRLARKLESGEPLGIGSMSHGGGIMSHAIHAGLEESGVRSELVFANEIRPELIEHASDRNPLWTERSIPISAPMQEFAHDQRALSNLPQVEIIEAGLPCSGASVAGRAKRKTSLPEEHPEVGHLVVPALMIIGRANPAILVLENVIPYASSASAAILRNSLRDLGYNTYETVLNGQDFNSLEPRERWCMVAVTEGLDFSWDMLQLPEKRTVYLSDQLDDIPVDHPAWKAMEGLKEKERRDLEAGKNFRMQIFTGDSTRIGTMTKGYAKVRSTDPKLAHPTNPDLLRQFTSREHARFKQVPEHLVEGLSETIAHEVLGQGIDYASFRGVGNALAKTIDRFMTVLDIKPTNTMELSQAIAAEMLELVDMSVTEVRKPVRGVVYEGPITVLDLGMAVQDVGNGVGILYRLDQLQSPEGRLPKLGDNIKCVHRMSPRIDITWVDDANRAPAIAEHLQVALAEKGLPPIWDNSAARTVPAPAVQSEPDAGFVFNF
nr:DNA cytosine methyltransferase [Pseudomonas luteola]